VKKRLDETQDEI
jgi:hypothetical protein